MDFRLDFFEALSPGKTPESYECVMTDCVVSDLRWVHPTMGTRFESYLEVDGELRYVHGRLHEGKIKDFELAQLGPNDSFLGISLQMHPEMFQARLNEIGIRAHFDEDVLELEELPICFYCDNDQLFSIAWSAFQQSRDTRLQIVS